MTTPTDSVQDAAQECACGCGGQLNTYKGRGRWRPRFLPGHFVRTAAWREANAAKMSEAVAARVAAQPVLICQCGCGEVIPPKPSHRYKPPKYIQAHYLAMGTSSRVVALREAKAKTRMAPPSGWVAPSGVCECGCGQRTPIATTSRPERDQYHGYPLRFLRGHNTRGLAPEQTSQWKGGRMTDRSGYVALLRPDHPAAQKQGYVLEHRMVYEDSRGVRLPKNVLVHHINGVKDDNRPENLVAFTRVEHRRAHTLANEVISLFLDDRLLEAAKAYVREHGDLPDLEALTAQVYGHR